MLQRSVTEPHAMQQFRALTGTGQKEQLGPKYQYLCVAVPLNSAREMQFCTRTTLKDILTAISNALQQQSWIANTPSVNETGTYGLKLMQIWQERQQVSQGLCHGSTHYGIAICSHLLENGQEKGCPHL